VRRMRYLAAQDERAGYSPGDRRRDRRSPLRRAPAGTHASQVESASQPGQGTGGVRAARGKCREVPAGASGAEMYFNVALDCLAAQHYAEARWCCSQLRRALPASPVRAQGQALLDRPRQAMKGPAPARGRECGEPGSGQPAGWLRFSAARLCRGIGPAGGDRSGPSPEVNGHRAVTRHVRPEAGGGPYGARVPMAAPQQRLREDQSKRKGESLGPMCQMRLSGPPACPA